MDEAAGPVSSDDKLVQNLQKQLDRLVEQINDLEDCKKEISEDEYSLIQQDTREQIHDFEASLEKIQKGNVTLNSKVSIMKAAIRDAITKSFNTAEIKQNFSSNDDVDAQLAKLDENYHLRKIDRAEYHEKKVGILRQLQYLGRKLTPAQEEYLHSRLQHDPLNNRLEQIQEQI